MCVCVCVRAYVRVCVRACVRACMRACVRAVCIHVVIGCAQYMYTFVIIILECTFYHYYADLCCILYFFSFCAFVYDMNLPVLSGTRAEHAQCLGALEG